MEAFVLKTLKRLRKEAPKRFKALRDTCDELIVALGEKEKANGVEAVDTDADKFFEPLELACETRQPKLMEIGLDALHYLIEHGYLKGKSKVNVYQESVVDGESEPRSNQRALMDVIIEVISKCSDEFDDSVQLQVIKALLTAITSLHCEVHESSLLLAVRACFHIHLISKNVVNKTTAKAALTQMLSVVNQRMELHEARRENDLPGAILPRENSEARLALPSIAESESEELGEEGVDGTAAVSAVSENHKENSNNVTSAVDNVNGGNALFPSVYHKDAYLLFRALCKLSMKGLNEDGQPEAIALQNKVLSLELILNILQNSGPAFRTGDRFIYAVRQYLCVSLLTNCTSQVAQITGLSLQIFVVAMASFKDHLKSELEVFVSTIFLRILESENSTYDHKCRVLEVFQNICRDPSTLVELFINYDCDLEAIDLFARFVAGFAKIAKNPSLSPPSRVNVDFMASTARRAQQEEQHIRTLGLEGLVIIIRSLEASSGLAAAASKLRIIGTVDELIREKEKSERSEPSSSDSDLFAGKSGVSDKPAADANGAIEDNAAAADLVTSAVQPGSVTASSSSSVDIVHAFDKKQKIQEEIETGILKFNLSPKKGLAYLAALGHIEMTPRGVALFFRQYQDRLDKTAIGDYLGREREYENGFCLKVLHEYVADMDFADMAFDKAIRYFLGGFRLPGEAQKIDRLMEKFAERYFLQNRDSFASADMAFILAFSTIMLQTNLHNPAIRDDKRMTKEQFIKQNKGISADGELSDEMLSEIYDRIAAEPISITSDDKIVGKRVRKEEQSAFVVFQATSERRKKDAFNTERREMIQTGEAMIKLNSRRGSVFVRNSGGARSDEAYVRPMFEVVWPSVLGVLSQILEMYDDHAMVQLCLSGFQHCILLSCRLDFSVARNTFIHALAKFTTLDTVREMREKNVQCVRLLLTVALSEGDFLEESWTQVLQSISQLARLQLLASGSHTDDMFFSDSAASSNSAGAPGASTSEMSKYFRKNSTGGSGRNGSVSGGGGYQDKFSASATASYDPFTKLFMGPSRAEATRLVEEANAELILREVDSVLVDRIYLNSINLGGDSVRHFVKSLCAVSLLEISTSSSMNSLRGRDSATDSSTPRIFSMQKLVEVADCNMHSRSRLDWSSIWALLAQHFSQVGLHENESLALYAIDSLKQLSIKFLQKDELSNFNFQRLFLKPFETIMTRSRSLVTKDLVLRCIDNMIRACASNIHSGWRSIFAIFEVSAGQDSREIAGISFDIVDGLMTSQFELLTSDFVELMNCLVAFVSSNHTPLSLRALGLLATCADHLADGHVLPNIDSHSVVNPSDISNSTSVLLEGGAVADEDSSVFRLWWPLLLGLSTAVGDGRLQVRVKALDTLQLVLRKNGKLFSAQTWSVIFKGVLFPMIDSAKTDNTVQPKSAWPTELPPPSQNKQSWIGTMAVSALSVCVELYQLFRTDCGLDGVLQDLLVTLEDCICQDTESLALVGLRVFRDLVLSLLSVPANGEDGGGRNADIVTAHVTGTMLRNMCFYFGEAGGIDLESADVSSEIRQSVTECPLSARRRSKDLVIAGGGSGYFTGTAQPTQTTGTSVHTAYGPGVIAEILEPDSSLELPGRYRVSLPWGQLFGPTTVRYTIADVKGTSGATTSGGALELQSWPQFIASAMTTMVAALDLLRLSDQLLRVAPATEGLASPAGGPFQLRHYKQFLRTLETYHWHAVRFNASMPLRLKLHQRGFMNENRSATNLSSALPDLLEQEVRSLEQILRLLCALYDSDTSGSDNGLECLERRQMAHESLERLGSLVLSRYVIFEEHRLPRSAAPSSSAPGRSGDDASSDEDEEEEDEDEQRHQQQLEDDDEEGRDGDSSSVAVMKMVANFEKARHEAYKPSVLILLRAVAFYSARQFAENVNWLAPLLSRLVVCSDLEVRLCLRDIYRGNVSPLIIINK